VNDQVKKFTWQGADIKSLSFVLILGSSLWFCPAPEGLSVKTWHLFAIFFSTIVALIAKPLPMGAVAILSIATATLTGTLTLKQSLSSFSSGIVWLIVSAFLLARGFIKTGLGSRIAYYFVSVLGKKTIGLAYGLTTTEFLLAPFMPSNTARGAGIIYPIISSLNKEFDSSPDNGTERKMGSYLIKLLYQVNVVTSAMFLTATAPNPLICGLAQKHDIIITWGDWALAALVPGLCNLIILPILLYYLYPPTIKNTPDAPKFAKIKLQQLGPLKVEECIMLGTFALLLTLWIFGGKYGISATTAALTGLSVLLLTGVLSWEDIIKEKNAWNTFIWMATLIMLSAKLTELGMMTWFGNNVQDMVKSLDWMSAVVFIVLLYFYSHYFFASMTAHVTSFFPALVVVGIAAGAPPMLLVLLLAVTSSLCAGITHYGTGSAPVFFGTNYVSIKDWWRLGFIVSVVNLLIWTIVGSLWWRVLGLWS